MNAHDLDDKLAEYRRTCRKGTEWLLDLMNPDGSLGPARTRLYYYRVPWAFALMGEITAASRAMDWIVRNMFTAEGAFEGVTPQGIYESRYGPYPLSCLLVGATLLGRFDVLRPGARHLHRYQDPETGGFFDNLRDDPRVAEQEVFPTAQGGMTLLRIGEIESARKAGQWFERLWELQPDIGHKLYHVYSRAKGLVTDYALDQEVLYVTKKDERWQHHFNGGIAAAFLTELYMATAEPVWLDLARQYEAFSMTTDSCQFESMQMCKSGWGSGLLYLVTREAAYRDWTVRLGDWFVGLQHEDGHWENTKAFIPIPTLDMNIEVTAEFVMHVANIITYLSV